MHSHSRVSHIWQKQQTLVSSLYSPYLTFGLHCTATITTLNSALHLHLYFFYKLSNKQYIPLIFKQIYYQTSPKIHHFSQPPQYNHHDTTTTAAPSPPHQISTATLVPPRAAKKKQASGAVSQCRLAHYCWIVGNVLDSFCIRFERVCFWKCCDWLELED